MIQLIDKSNCCGCEACAQVCPKGCISMERDAEGFLYPHANADSCIDCGLCEKVCPCLNAKTGKQPIAVYAAVNPDEEIRKDSSSGGVFWMLVKQTIEEGGVVFGAAFDDERMVFHSSAETIEDARKFRGSKYVQSRVDRCYKEVHDYLKQGRKVLFSGTACHIAALKSYLRKEYNNLITVDVVCHGVPSPSIWKEYLKKIGNNKRITFISFRDKTSGWRNYDFYVEYADHSFIRETHNKNLFMRGYLHGLYLRPSCHKCIFKSGKCESDITLGDFWGVEKVLPMMDDNRGVSVVMANTKNGMTQLQNFYSILKELEYEKVVAGNPSIIKATAEPVYRRIFMNHYLNGEGINATVDVLKQMRPSLMKRLLNRAERLFKNL